MQLKRAYAFAVTPERKAENAVQPPGGSLTVTKDLEGALSAAHEAAQFHEQSTIDFQVDLTTRTSEVRGWVIDVAFGTKEAAGEAAQGLARRLAESMDRRSAHPLFLATSFRDGDRGRTTLWAFPRDDAFQFRGGGQRPTVRLLKDVFSRQSRLRKAALFEGRNVRTDFLSGRVLDFQTAGPLGGAAEFWVERFLGCHLGIDDEAGTKLLAECLRKVHAKLKNVEDKEELNTAIMAARASRRRRFSIRRFAEEFLSDELAEALISAAPNPDAANATFNIQRDVFERAVHFVVYRLSSEVMVWTPFGEIGHSVNISQGPQRILRCEGPIVDEKVRSGRA